MMTLKKTRLALLVALLSSSAVYADSERGEKPQDPVTTGAQSDANVGSVHDDTVDAPDDTWQSANGRRSDRATPGLSAADKENASDRDEKANADASDQLKASETDDAQQNQQAARESQSQQGSQARTGDDNAHVVHFDFDSAELNDQAKIELRQAVERLQGQNENLVVTVSGHTDATGPEQYNKDLAERRANAVRAFLQDSQLQVSNIDVQALGEDQPVSSNETESGREENRRVEISASGEGDAAE